MKRSFFISKIAFVCALFAVSQVAFAFSKPTDVVDDEVLERQDVVESAEEHVDAVHIGVLSGPSGIPMAWAMENVSEISNAKVEYDVFAGANLLLPKLLKGEIDIGFLPPNVAAKVYNANNGAIIAAAVAGNGMMSLITKDKNVKSIKDLNGKTVNVAGQGATPDYMMRYLLSKNGVNAELDFSIPNAEIAPSLIAGKIEYAVVPEPFATVATLKNAEITRAIDIQSAFAEASGTDGVFPMTLIVVNAKFAAAHPMAVENFLTAYSESAAWTLENPKDAGSLVEKHSIGLNSAVSAAAIPNAAYTFKRAKDAKGDVEKILGVFLEFDATSIGGKLPDDGFYF